MTFRHTPMHHKSMDYYFIDSDIGHIFSDCDEHSTE